MTEKVIARPGLKLMLIGGSIMVLGLAGLIATPLAPGSSENRAVLIVLLLAVVGGGTISLTGTIKRLIHTFRANSFLETRARD